MCNCTKAAHINTRILFNYYCILFGGCFENNNCHSVVTILYSTVTVERSIVQLYSLLQLTTACSIHTVAKSISCGWDVKSRLYVISNKVSFLFATMFSVLPNGADRNFVFPYSILPNKRNYAKPGRDFASFLVR